MEIGCQNSKVVGAIAVGSPGGQNLSMPAATVTKSVAVSMHQLRRVLEILFLDVFVAVTIAFSALQARSNEPQLRMTKIEAVAMGRVVFRSAGPAGAIHSLQVFKRFDPMAHDRLPAN